MAKGKKRKQARSVPPLPDFDAWAERLRTLAKGAAKRIGGREPELQRREQPSSVFKMAAYSYRRRLQRAKLIDDLRAYIQKRDGKRWEGHEDTPALWVLRLTATPRESDAVRKRRSRLAAALELAAFNKVRPELLLGFLYEAGPSTMIEQDAAAMKKYDWAKYYRKSSSYKGSWKRGEDPDTGTREGKWR